MSSLRPLNFLIVGDVGVGKHSILRRLAGGNLEDIKETRHKVQLLTINFPDQVSIEFITNIDQNQPREHIIRSIRDVVCTIYVFDITNRSTFCNIERHMTEYEGEVSPDNPILISNKIDQWDWQVKAEESSQYANLRKMRYFALSAETGENFENFINYLIEVFRKDPKPIEHAPINYIPIERQHKKKQKIVRRSVSPNQSKRIKEEMSRNPQDQITELQDQLELVQNENMMLVQLKSNYTVMRERYEIQARELKEKIQEIFDLNNERELIEKKLKNATRLSETQEFDINDFKKRLMQAENIILNKEKEINRLNDELISLKERKDKKSGSKKAKHHSKKSYTPIDPNRYKNINRIGKGRHGEVFLVQDSVSGGQYAKKVFTDEITTEEEGKQFKRINEIGCKTQHPCIAEMIGFINQTELESAFVIYELSANGTLQNIINAQPKIWNSTRKAICVMEIVTGMKYLHSLDIIHKYLKPSNIIFDKNFHAKMCDYSESTFIDIEQIALKDPTTAFFLSPELLNDGSVTKATDVFSFGSILFVIIFGTIPQLSLNDLKAGRTAQIPSNATAFANKLITGCWSRDPLSRPSFHDIQASLVQNQCAILDDVDALLVMDRLSHINHQLK